MGILFAKSLLTPSTALIFFGKEGGWSNGVSARMSDGGLHEPRCRGYLDNERR